MEEEKVDTSGLILDDQYFTTLAFVEVNENGERTFSFARKPGADTQIQKEEMYDGFYADPHQEYKTDKIKARII